MRSRATGVIVFLLILLIGVDANQHRYLQGTLRGFMEEGDRNTAEDGFDRDMKIAELDARLSNIEQWCPAWYKSP